MWLIKCFLWHIEICLPIGSCRGIPEQLSVREDFLLTLGPGSILEALQEIF